MSIGGTTSGTTRKRKPEDVTVLAMNVQGTKADDFGRAFKKIKPDLILTQENPGGKTHLFNVMMVNTVSDLNKDAASNTDFQYCAPIIKSEWYDKPKTLKTPHGKTYNVQSDASKKSYGVVYNSQKYKLLKPPTLVDYTVDPSRQKDIAEITRPEHVSEQGFGARPPLYMELERITTNERIGIFNYHAPPPNDPQHDQAMTMFKQSDTLQHSLTTNHRTLIVGDLNDTLKGVAFTEFKERVSYKYDHMLGHGFSGHEDLKTEHADVLTNLCTNIKDHYGHCTEFKW